MRVRLVVEGWSVVDPEKDEHDVERPDPASVASELVRANVALVPELVGIVFEEAAKNPAELLAAVAKLPGAVGVWPHVLTVGRASQKAWPT